MIVFWLFVARECSIDCQSSVHSSVLRRTPARMRTWAEPEVPDLDCEFSFICGLGAGVIVTLVFVVILRYLLLFTRRTSSPPSPSSPADVRTEVSNVAQSRISDRSVVSW